MGERRARKQRWLPLRAPALLRERGGSVAGGNPAAGSEAAASGVRCDGAAESEGAGDDGAQELLCAPVRTWFERRFQAPTPAQAGGWPRIAAGEDTLIAAPTGTGKTLSAFLVVIDRLVRRALAGGLDDEIEAVYVSPLRALSHDIQRNLETPLREIREEAERMGLAIPEIRTAVRTGDTPAAERRAMLRRAPHILVTTPESLYLLLTSEHSRRMLSSARCVIVDEIHALARDKRGAHLALSLERLEALTEQRPQRIGLSATQRPIEEIARFLVGSAPPANGSGQTDGNGPADGSALCAIVDAGHQRDLDLAIEVPRDEDLCAVASNEQWEELLGMLIERIEGQRTTLIFVNTRRLAERLAHRLRERIGEARVAAHHGSLSRERRLGVEQKLRDGELSALVATASLELGIDIGRVDLVCQIGSPRSIATFLQRVGRSGHALGRVPKGRLFPTSRDELVESAAVVRAARAGRLDAIHPPRAPLDILAQQLVAACACESWSEDALFALVRRAHVYAGLARADFDAVLEMLSRGFDTARGRRGAYLQRDRMDGTVGARRGARIAAIRSGGAIPDTGDYRVVLDPSETFLGTVGEDFAVESMAGDVFLLGTHTWRVRRVEAGVVRVVDAGGAPPSIPFWVGEAPARSEELSREVSALRAEVAAEPGGSARLLERLERECGLDPAGARQLADYVHAQRDATGRVPTCEDLVAERFFDESGGMQLVLHSPYGARVNRGLALAVRKRFCRAFNQELQCAATDDAAVLSLGPAQTFPLEELQHYLPAPPVREVLEQAVLATPLFAARWRWNANRALAVPRFSGKGRVPFAIQRMQAEDLLAACFPEQTACQEHVQYPLAIPDHPLVQQTLHDCLHEALDLEGVERVSAGIGAGEIRLHVMETVEPSPFTHEILNARPYAFLDDAPLEERRTRAVSLRRVLPENARDLTQLDAEAIARVCAEAAPRARDAGELCEWLVDAVVLRASELGEAALGLAQELASRGRAARMTAPDGVERWFAAERLAELRALWPGAPETPALVLPPALAARECSREAALERALGGHLLWVGPIGAGELAARIGVPERELASGLAALESRGRILRGRFTPGTESGAEQFCDRGLLARIHRYTIVRLRRESEPVSAHEFLRFLVGWQGVLPDGRALAEADLLGAIERLSGFEAPAAAWESELLPLRCRDYDPAWLDALCLSGAVTWGRVRPPASDGALRPSRATPIALLPRTDLEPLLQAAEQARAALAAQSPELEREPLRGAAARVAELLRERGALFARELQLPGVLPVQLEEGLRELVARGLVTCDGFAPLRRLFSVRPHSPRRRVRSALARAAGRPVAEGRWSLWRALGPELDAEARAEASAWRLLRRYGVVFRDLLAREWLPDGWREVHRALRRLEARGQVRGGRFVSGFIGEQFALPEAIPALRAARRPAAAPVDVRVCAADPLNLVGILTPGSRVAAGHSRWIVLRDGLPVSVIERGSHSALSLADPALAALGQPGR